MSRGDDFEFAKELGKSTVAAPKIWLPQRVVIQGVRTTWEREEHLIAEHAASLGLEVLPLPTKYVERRKALLYYHSDFVVGDLKFLRHAYVLMHLKPPGDLSYPTALMGYLGRRVSRVPKLTLVKWRLGQTGVPIFVKPAEATKRFTGFVAEHPYDHRFNGASDAMPVWTSEVVRFVSEYRYYIANGKLLSRQPVPGTVLDAPQPDQTVVEKALADYTRSGTATAGYAMDFGVTDTGQTLLVEVNRGFALGAYGDLSAADYWDVLLSHWNQYRSYVGNFARLVK